MLPRGAEIRGASDEDENLRLKSAGVGEKSTLDLPPSREGTHSEFAALCFARDHKKNSLNCLFCVKYTKVTTRSDTCIMLQVNESQ